MAARNYSNVAVSTTLSSGIGGGDSSFVVVDDTGWPTAPFLLVLEPDTAEEELVLVGAKTGTTFSSLTRGFGGTSGVAHNAGAVVKHVTVAEDHSLVWTHVHSGAGGDDTSPVAHGDLSGIGLDDHHAEDHATRHEVGGADPVAITHDQTTGKTVDDHHAQAHAHDGADGSGTVAHGDVTGQTTDDHHPKLHAADHASGGADPLNHDTLSGISADDHHAQDHAARHAQGGADAIEVDGHTEVASTGLSGSFTNIASFTLAIPAGWNSWKCVAFATFTVFGGQGDTWDQQILIDGVAQQTQTRSTMSVGDGSEAIEHGESIGGRRTGMVTTGNRTIALRARNTSGALTVGDIFLYARAVRTS